MPAWIINLLIGVLFSWVAFLLRPKPPVPPSAKLEDFKIPVAAPGEEIPVIYGTVWLRSPQVHWYGDLRTRPVTSTTGKKG